ncbi:MAG: hypothetical protein ACT4PJ_04780 [Gemmatimonadaceae bacterium]
MPHRVGYWLATAARTAAASALLVVTSCSSDDGELVVVVRNDSARAVIASPIDPRQLLRAAAAARSRPTGPLGDSIARYYAVASRADSLDALFQGERDALNREARSMANEDRRSRAYASAFDAYLRRAAAATRLRDARDEARRRAAALRARLGRRFPELGRAVTPSMRAALDSAARANGSEIQRAALRGGRTTMALAPGVWWIAIESDAGEISGVRRHEARPGMRDTVRVGG